MVFADLSTPSWSRVRLGRNILIGRPAVKTAVTAGGFRLFEARLREDGQLFLSADLYGEHGRRLGAFTSHAWQTPQRDADIYIAPQRVAVKDRRTGQTLLSVVYRDNELVVTSMDMRSRDGKRCALDTSGRLAVWAEHQAAPDWRSDIVWETTVDRIDLVDVVTTQPVPPFPRQGHAPPRGISSHASAR